MKRLSKWLMALVGALIGAGAWGADYTATPVYLFDAGATTPTNSQDTWVTQTTTVANLTTDATANSAGFSVETTGHTDDLNIFESATEGHFPSNEGAAFVGLDGNTYTSVLAEMAKSLGLQDATVPDAVVTDAVQGWNGGTYRNVTINFPEGASEKCYVLYFVFNTYSGWSTMNFALLNADQYGPYTTLDYINSNDATTYTNSEDKSATLNVANGSSLLVRVAYFNPDLNNQFKFKVSDKGGIGAIAIAEVSNPHAKTREISSAGGVWNDTTAWGGSLPEEETDVMLVATGDATLTMDTSSTITRLTLTEDETEGADTVTIVAPESNAGTLTTAYTAVNANTNVSAITTSLGVVTIADGKTLTMAPASTISSLTAESGTRALTGGTVASLTNKAGSALTLSNTTVTLVDSNAGTIYLKNYETGRRVTREGDNFSTAEQYVANEGSAELVINPNGGVTGLDSVTDGKEFIRVTDGATLRLAARDFGGWGSFAGDKLRVYVGGSDQLSTLELFPYTQGQPGCFVGNVVLDRNSKVDGDENGGSLVQWRVGSQGTPNVIVKDNTTAEWTDKYWRNANTHISVGEGSTLTFSAVLRARGNTTDRPTTTSQELHKYGAGVLNITVAQDVADTTTFTGATTVHAGTLKLSGEGTLGSSAVSVAETAILEFAKVGTFDNAITGSGTIKKTGVGDLTLSNATSFAGDLSIEATGAVNIGESRPTITALAEDATIAITPTDGEIVAGSITLPTADGITLTTEILVVTGFEDFTIDTDGTIKLPVSLPTWKDGSWSAEPAANESVIIDFGETTGQTCAWTCSQSDYGLLVVKGSGTIELSAASAVGFTSVQLPDDATASVTLKTGVETWINEALTGQAALTLESGTVIQTSAGIVASNYDGALTLNGGTWQWGNNNTITADTTINPIAASVTVNAGATLLVHPYSGKSLNKNDTGKVKIDAPIVLNGGLLKTADGSYFIPSVSVTAASNIEIYFDKALAIDRLVGAENLTVRGKDTGYGAAQFYVWRSFSVDNTQHFTGVLNLSNLSIFHVDTTSTCAQSKIVAADTVTISLTGNRQFGALEGAATIVGLDKTLTIGGYAGETTATFAGTIPDTISVALVEGTSWALTGVLGTVTDGVATYSKAIPISANSTLSLGLANPTTLSGAISGTGTLNIAAGKSISLTADIGTDTKTTTTVIVENDATLELAASAGSSALPSTSTVKVAPNGTLELKSGLSFIKVKGTDEGAGKTLVTGAFTLGIGGDIDPDMTTALEVAEDTILTLRARSSKSLSPTSLVLNSGSSIALDSTSGSADATITINVASLSGTGTLVDEGTGALSLAFKDGATFEPGVQLTNVAVALGNTLTVKVAEVSEEAILTATTMTGTPTGTIYVGGAENKDYKLSVSDNKLYVVAKVYVAQVGDNKYEDLATAIAALNGANGTVTLLKSGLTLPSPLPENVTFVKATGVEIDAPAGYTWNEEGQLVLDKTYVAQVGETQYETLANAITAANAATEAVTIKILEACTLDVITSVTGNITLDLNGKTITLIKAGRLDLAGSANVTVTGEGSIVNQETGDDATTHGYLFVARENTSLTIENGTYYAGLTVAQANAAANITVKDGSFKAWSQYEDKYWIFNQLDGSTGKIAISGGSFFGWNPADNDAEGEYTGFAPGMVGVYNDSTGYYTLIEGTYVAGVAGTQYTTLADAITAANAATGAVTIDILADCTLDAITSVTGNITLDLNGKTITLIKAGRLDLAGTANVTVTGEGSIVNQETGDDATTHGYLFVARENTSLTIENGTYYAGLTVAQANAAANITVKDGSFKAWSQYEGKYWIFNQLDGSTGTIAITGGSFFGWNPADNDAEGEYTGFAPGMVGVYNTSTGYYTLIEGTYVARTGGTQYTTLADAIDAAADGATVTLLADVALSAPIDVANTVTLDLGAYSITPAAGYAKDCLVGVKYGANLTITGTTGAIDANNIEGVYTAVKVTLTGDTYTNADAKLTVNGGTLKGYYYGVCGNGLRQHTDITIAGGTVTCYAADGIGIYQPQNGTLTVSGGTVEGASAIYVKSGTVTISGGTLKATGAKVAYNYDGNGAQPTGDTIVVDNCNYPGSAPTVAITAGKFESTNGVQIGSYSGNNEDQLAEVTKGENVELTAPEGTKWDDGTLVKIPTVDPEDVTVEDIDTTTGKIEITVGTTTATTTLTSAEAAAVKAAIAEAAAAAGVTNVTSITVVPAVTGGYAPTAEAALAAAQLFTGVVTVDEDGKATIAYAFGIADAKVKGGVLYVAAKVVGANGAAAGFGSGTAVTVTATTKNNATFADADAADAGATAVDNVKWFKISTGDLDLTKALDLGVKAHK